MTKANKFSTEVRERAVRLLLEHRGQYPALGAGIESIAPKIGGVPQTLNEWFKCHQVDPGARDGITTSNLQSAADPSVRLLATRRSSTQLPVALRMRPM